jgi:hypothetical protein
LSGKHTPRFLLGSNLRNVADSIRHHAKKYTRQPNRHDAEWIEDDSLLEVGHLLRSQAED